MKKVCITALAFLLLFAGSFAEGSHLPAFDWERSAETHWQLDEAGAAVNEGAHSLDENRNCSICGAQVLDKGNGAYAVIEYDAQGNILRDTIFENGEKTRESVHLYAYDAAGEVLLDLEFVDGFYSRAAYSTEDVIQPSWAWERNGESHWQLDENGAAINEGSHTLDELLNCSVCGAHVLDWGEGYFDVTDYNAYSHILRSTTFENGEKTYETTHAYIYDEAGMPLLDLEYIDNEGYLGETVYTVDGDGILMLVAQTAWFEDGSYSINEYDEEGNCIRSASFAEDGALVSETVTEYALDDGGWYYEWKTTVRFESGDTFYDERNVYGDTVRSVNRYADGTAWSDSTYEYEYLDGMTVWSKQYSFGVLVREEFFDEEGSLKQEIEYWEDGSRTVYEYDAEGDMLSSVSYAADGSVIPEED